MPSRRAKLVGSVALALVLLVSLVALAAAVPLSGLKSFLNRWKPARSEASAAAENETSAERVPGEPNTVGLPADVVQSLHIQTVPAEPATQPRALELSGRLALDPNHLARVHARFGGEVVEIEQVPDTLRRAGRTQYRPLRPGDRVEAGQLLAVIWSKDLGEKKSELVDALSLLRLDQGQLDRLEALAATAAVSESMLAQTRRSVEADTVAVARAERTLRSWRLTDDEIDAIKAEAERILQKNRQPDKEKDRDWAKVDVRARFAGTIEEKNVAVGDIVDTTTDLFKIADTRTLVVWADAYEEDLPALLTLPPDRRTWTLRLKADPDAPPIQGQIDYVADIIDPTQHTALVSGRVDNSSGRLRAGQFVTGTVALPPKVDEVVVPASALIEDGRASVLFVQADPTQPRYTLRRVAVGRRLPEAVTVRSRLTPQQERQGLQAVRPGERVVRKGAVELRKALEELQATTAE